MSGSSAPPPQTARSSAPADVGVREPELDCCPLCGAPLDPHQEWCLRCGAAARTRMATPPRWKPPIIALALVAGIALAVLAAALVKLAGSSSSPATPAAASAPGPASVTSPGTAALPPSATTPRPSAPRAHPPVAAVPVRLVPPTKLTSSTVTLHGTVNPQGVHTSCQFQYGLTTSYGGSAPGTPLALGAGKAVIAVFAGVGYLKPGTTYHYRLTAVKAGRVVSTADATFTTLPGRAPAGAGPAAPGQTGASR